MVTCGRLKRALKKLWDHKAHAEEAREKRSDDASDEEENETCGQMSEDWNCVPSDTQDDNSKKYNTSITKLCEAMKGIKGYARSINNFLRKKKRKETETRINSDNQESEHAFFRYLRKRSAEVYARQTVEDYTHGVVAGWVRPDRLHFRSSIFPTAC